MNNRTKIICTIGPSVASVAKLTALAKNGMSVVRINCSHGDTKTRDAGLKLIREVEANLGRPLAVMLDLQGPKIRVGVLGAPLRLNVGDVWQISTKLVGSAEKKIIPVDFKALPQAVRKGLSIFFDDGLIETKVLRVNDESIWVEIVHGGLLETRKGLNIPFYQGRSAVLSKKDHEDLAWGLKNHVDFVALSFVRHPEDVALLRRNIKRLSPNHQPQVIAKIEKPEAVESLDAIVDISDGILVARGDLGVEMQPYRVPVVQKQIIESCRVRRKPVIVATQMLDSMRRNPLPTRAEVSDVASAIFSGTDAVLLTGETSSGLYPVEACTMMNKIIGEVENHLVQKTFRKTPNDFGLTEVPEGFVFNAMQTAEDIGAKAMVILTKHGYLTRTLSKLHPKQPVFSMASDLTAYRQLGLLWGVFPLEISNDKIDDRIASGIKILRERRVLRNGDHIVFIYRDYQSENLNLKVVSV